MDWGKRQCRGNRGGAGSCTKHLAYRHHGETTVGAATGGRIIGSAGRSLDGLNCVFLPSKCSATCRDRAGLRRNRTGDPS
jgi:hypothetical protein